MQTETHPQLLIICGLFLAILYLVLGFRALWLGWLMKNPTRDMLLQATRWLSVALICVALIMTMAIRAFRNHA